jgi:alkylated DNA repair protein (DNA oxidative demethylase)
MPSQRTFVDTLTLPLFSPPDQEAFGPDAYLLRAFARRDMFELWEAIRRVVQAAPLRHMKTPSGAGLSAATTNCGTFGWVTDCHGYRYSRTDPMTGRNWPAMSTIFRTVATQAAEKVGFEHFCPDVALINRYAPGTKMGLHQDRDERDLSCPIVSISLGLPATFVFGGPERQDRTQRIVLADSDVFVWGGRSRLYYHGILPLKHGHHPRTGAYRFNITFRKAG